MTFIIDLSGSSGEPELLQCPFVCGVHHLGHAGPGPDRIVQRTPGAIQARCLPTAKENGYVVIMRAGCLLPFLDCIYFF